MHNKHLGRIATIQAETLDSIAPEQYGSRKAKAADIQALTTRLFYDIIRKIIIPATNIFADLVSKYELMVHSIAALSHQRVDVPKEPMLCNFTKLQNMSQSVRMAFGDSKYTYGGDTWAVVSTPLLNYLRKNRP